MVVEISLNNYEDAHDIDGPLNRRKALRLAEIFIKKAQWDSFVQAEGYIASAQNMAMPRESWAMSAKQIEEHVRLLNLLHINYLPAALVHIRIMLASAQ